VTGRVRIDLGALSANYRALRDAAAPGTCGAVVKADAYGLGAGPVARRLWREGCRHYFVTTAEEGRALRRTLPDARIYVFEGALDAGVAALRDARLLPVLNDAAQLARWRAAGAPGPVAVQVDTGMHRLGFAPDIDPARFTGLEVQLLMTHLACADEPGHPVTRLQLDRFAAVRRRFPGVPVSVGNSAGVLGGSTPPGDISRPGIGLYGGNPFSGAANPLETVVTVEGQVLQVRAVAPDESIGYGATFRAARMMEVAVVGIGYADGLPRLLSNRGMAAFGAVRCPIVGRVSMDLTVVDVSGLGAREGDWLEFIGSRVTVDEVAAWAGTIAYEILTGLGPRLEREYLGG
jgi:alanine racemase